MPLRIAIVGFQHGHVAAYANLARRLEYCEIVGVVDENEDVRWMEESGLERTHETFDDLLNDVEFDVVATAEYFAKRGSVVIKALEHGKHAIADKPLCTSIEELREIKRLCEQNDLEVSLDLSMRCVPLYVQMCELVQEGRIGEFLAATVFGQHTLAYKQGRPDWYFEPGKHGGTINDLWIHGADIMRAATGREFETVVAAEAWNTTQPEIPHFQVGAQCLMTMTGGPRVMADCSYMTARSWQFFLTGSEAYLQMDRSRIMLRPVGGQDEEVELPSEAVGRSPFEDFVSHLELGTERVIPMEDVFRSQMAVLTAQQAADTGQRDMPIPEI